MTMGNLSFFALRHDVVFIKICIPITRENTVTTLGFTHIAKSDGDVSCIMTVLKSCFISYFIAFYVSREHVL